MAVAANKPALSEAEWALPRRRRIPTSGRRGDLAIVSPATPKHWKGGSPGRKLQLDRFFTADITEVREWGQECRNRFSPLRNVPMSLADAGLAELVI